MKKTVIAAAAVIAVTLPVIMVGAFVLAAVAIELPEEEDM